MDRMKFQCGYDSYYEVIKKSDNHYAIFLNNEFISEKFITHRESWKQATKVAKLLSEAYMEGANSEW